MLQDKSSFNVLLFKIKYYVSKLNRHLLYMKGAFTLGFHSTKFISGLAIPDLAHIFISYIFRNTSYKKDIFHICH